MGIFRRRREQQSASWPLEPQSPSSDSPPPIHPWPETPNHQFEEAIPVAGDQHRSNVLNTLIGTQFLARTLAVLQPEPGNTHDSNAVAVHTPHGQVGYIPRKLSASVADEVASRIASDGYCVTWLFACGGYFPSLLLSPEADGPFSTWGVFDALLRSGFPVARSEHHGFAIEENDDGDETRLLVYWTTANFRRGIREYAKGTEESISEVAKMSGVLRDQGYRARSSRSSGIPYVSISAFVVR